MRKLGWYALRIATAMFVLGSMGLLAANLYVQSHSVQQRIRTALTASLGLPVHLRKTTVTPWDGVRLDGVTLYEDEPGRPDGSPDLLQVGSFRVRLAWWTLLTERRLVIEDTLIERPHLTLSPGRDRIQAQAATEPEDAASPTLSPARGSQPGVAAAGPSPAVDTPSVPESGDAPRRVVERRQLLLPPADRLRMRHGEITSLDSDGHTVLRVEGINSNACVDDPRHAHGALWFARASMPGVPGATLSGYRTAVDYDAEEGLAVRDGWGQFAGGELATDFRLQPQEDRWSFTSSARLENAALGSLTRNAADQPPLADGELHGNFDLRGLLGDPTSLHGGGRVWLDGAKLRNFPLLRIIGQVLRIADLSQLEFKQAQMDYRMDGDTLHIDGLTLVSNNSQVELRGRYLLTEDQLDLHGRLTIDHAISHQLPQFIESNFTRCDAEAPGSRFLDFDVTGSRDDPRCNLYDRLTAGPMKSLLDNMLAPKSKNPKNQRPEGTKKARLTPGNTTPAP